MVKFYGFLLFVYLNYVKEDWDTWTTFGRVVIYPFWWVRSLFVWAFCFIFVPSYLLEGSDFQEELNRMRKESGLI